MWYLILLPVVLGLSPRAPTQPVARLTEDVEELWLNVRLNHYMAFDAETFPMRFLYNPSLATSNNLVIVIGSAAADPAPLRSGVAYELAEELKAGLIHTEHRFYGQSRPSNETSLDMLRYLTVDQALGDLAQLIGYVRSDEFENGQFKHGAVTVSGCGYGGALAAWTRLAHPHLAQAALSESPLLLARDDVTEYFPRLWTALEARGGEDCASTVRALFTQLQAQVVTTAGANELSSMFNTCTTLSATNLLDRATFFHYVLRNLGDLVERAVPGSVEDACVQFTDASVADPVQRLASWLAGRTAPCARVDYAAVVSAFANATYDDEDAANNRLRLYGSCSQLGLRTSTAAGAHALPDVLPLSYFNQLCDDVFGQGFSSRLQSGITRTNLLFGGLTHIPDYVVTVVGDIDPWGSVGPTVAHGRDKAPVLALEGGSHCGLTRGSAASSEELSLVKQRVLRELVYQVTGEHLAQDNFAARLTASALTVVAVVMMLMA